ncbi:hypothetical protein Tco_1235497, partial [Tanacetum coccineum]
EPALVDENEESKEEEEFKDEEEFEDKEPQEQEEDMKVDIGEEENESELTFLYEEAAPLNPPPPAPDLESEDVIKVEDMVEPDNETVPNSVHEVVCGHEMAYELVEKKGRAKDKYYGKLIIDLGNEMRCSVGEIEAVLEDLIKEFGDDSWGVVFVERPNETIDVPVKDEESPSSKPRGSSRDSYIRVNGGGARGSGQGGPPYLQRWFEKTEMVFGISECAEGKKAKFAAALQRPSLTWWNTKVPTMGLEAVNQIPWTKMKQMMTAEFYPAEEVQRMEHELWNLKVKEYHIIAYT